MKYSCRITPKGVVEPISSIKAIRNLTGWGLKEAKDFVDVFTREGVTVQTLNITSEVLSTQHLVDAKQFYNLIPEEIVYLEALLDMAKTAIGDKRFELAIDLINLYRKYTA